MFKPILFIFVLFFTQKVLACSCSHYSLSEEWSNFDTVFIANISDIEVVKEGDWELLKRGEVKGILEVLKTFKGDASKVTHLQAAHKPMGADCTITLSKERYLVVTNKTGTIPIGFCSATRRIDSLSYKEKEFFRLK